MKFVFEPLATHTTKYLSLLVLYIGGQNVLRIKVQVNFHIKTEKNIPLNKNNNENDNDSSTTTRTPKK